MSALELRIKLTADQARDFGRCAETAGVSIERWIVECAAVKAADVIDAVQATERRRRLAKGSDNAQANAQALRRRKERRRGDGATP